MKTAGVNLPYLYFKLIDSPEVDLDIKSVRPVRPINSIVEFNDFNFVLKGKVGLIKWYREYKGSECKYFNSAEDPKPYRLERCEYIRFLRKRILKF